ncbi:kynureninase [Pseudoxanthomonas broegbernensis]|uniref:Kynureninase n=1 Tax=Pseudoxanthomonas broegbernensis TaxID=83619 RepID=A0A7V8GPR3_9GAMM|nr:kynureninase [Pseudoxanthomonas broegbernensis]KAF1687777.1 kynureninase [Pseudoxanthomonas broegbernensis]MBB6064816.1 kynureninase [Pseudoxanthomonas broegbernensis]
MSNARTHALALDAADPLRPFRGEFMIPRHRDGERTYFVGNSLGLQPRGARAQVLEVLDKWGAEGVEGHFGGDTRWMDYHALVREPLARLVGARPAEVVAMNTLTVNLHLMLASFYRPTRERPAVLMEAGAFPSDRHAVESQIRLHGLDPATALVEVEADEPGGTVSMAAIERAIAEYGPRLALVLWPGVQYRTGQAFDLADISRLAHAQGAAAGFDLAHAVGNLPLALHDAGADFAVWCHYKYVNAGPGAVAGCFVHERHGDAGLPRLAGWWGHEAATRFRMAPQFVPAAGAEGWQLSNPPVLALAPLRASLDQFERAGGMAALRAKSERLTGFLDTLVRQRLGDTLEILTPAEPARRGCQLSLRVTGGGSAAGRGRELFDYLRDAGILGDWREPDVIRIAPVPLYNRYSDVLRFVEEVEHWRGV